MKMNENNYSNNYYNSYPVLSITRFDIPQGLVSIIKQLNKNDCVLDLGCNIGNFTHLIHTLNDKPTFYGVDIVDIKSSVEQSMIFLKGSAEKIPFSDNFFDLIIVNHVVEHLQSPIDAFKEIRRVLKKDGICYVATPSTRSLFLPSISNFYQDYTHIRPFNSVSLKRIIKDSGCSPLKISYVRNYKTIFIAPYLVLKSIFKLNVEPFSNLISNVFGGTIYAIFKKQ